MISCCAPEHVNCHEVNRRTQLYYATKQVTIRQTLYKRSEPSSAVMKRYSSTKALHVLVQANQFSRNFDIRNSRRSHMGDLTDHLSITYKTLHISHFSGYFPCF